ncbi:MAG TPA: hypothetical protein VMU06_02165 [Stellaceae bacterium]|nr:hypothetical protein [Stellaceae bacterium]
MPKRKIMIGKKIPPSKLKKLAAANIGVTSVLPPTEREVEGQQTMMRLAQCPGGHMTWLVYDTEHIQYYKCGVCGCAFIV